MRTVLVVLVVLVVVLAGCGSSRPDPAVVAASLQRSVRAHNHGSRFEHVHCARQTGSEYECVGDYTASRAEVKSALAGYDTSRYTTADWRSYGAGVTKRMTMTVTVNSDGSFVSRPS